MDEDRHGRHAAADRDPRRRPSAGFRTSSGQRFERLVADAISTLSPAHLRRMREVRTIVEEVPRPGEGLAHAHWDDAVVASIDDPDAVRTGDESTVLRIYRRPLERHADDAADLVDLLREVVAEQLTDRFGTDDG